MKLDRRSFLEGAAASATLLASRSLTAQEPVSAAAPGFGPLNQWPGRVVVNYDNRHTATPTGGTADDRGFIVKLVDDSVCTLTGLSDVGDAWKSVLLRITAQSRVAIKINTLNAAVPSHPFVVLGIVKGLLRMRIGGTTFSPSNITLYDGANKSGFADAGFTAELFPDIRLIKYPKDGFVRFDDGAHGNQPYAPALREADYLINVPGLRGHGAWAGGVTLGFKSHYGTYPPLYHDADKGPGFLRDINCTGPVWRKTALTVVSALYGLREGNGPKGSAEEFPAYVATRDPASKNMAPNTLILSTDPVTAEYQAIRILRIRDGKSFKPDTMPDYLKASAGVAGVLEPTLNIGVLDPKAMEVRKIVNGRKG